MQYAYAVLPLGFVGLSLWFGKSFVSALLDNLFWIVALPLFGFVGLPWINRWAVKRQLRSNPMLGGPQVFALRDDGLMMENRASSVLVRWATLLRVVESADHFLFYYTPQCAYYLPLAAVPVDELPAVRSRIRASVTVPTTLRDQHPPTPA
ncbi:MAG TPA: YcxB family protein [Gemmatimonadaceae bacterium]